MRPRIRGPVNLPLAAVLAALLSGGSAAAVEAGTRWALVVEDRSRLSRRAEGSFVDDPASADPGRVPVREERLLAVFR